MSNLVQTYPQSTTLIPIQDVERMGSAISASGLFGLKTREQAIALMLLAQAEGLHPVTAARDYHIMNGKPAMKADTMLARFQAAGGRVEWKSYTDERVEGVFTHPNGGSVTVDWTLERAERAGLKSDTWKRYPRAMLRARVISEGIRTVYPGVLCGMYTPEEIVDMPEISVQGIAETTGPDHSVRRTPFDADAAERIIAATTDKIVLRQWLAATRQEQDWKPGQPEYEILKVACAERAKQIEAENSIAATDNPAEG